MLLQFLFSNNSLEILNPSNAHKASKAPKLLKLMKLLKLLNYINALKTFNVDSAPKTLNANNDPTTIGARSLTIPRPGIGVGDSIAFYVWFLRIWYPHFMQHCASKISIEK